jgi:hypothetical protein
MSVYVHIDVLNYGCGSICHIFGVLVSGCIHTYINCELEYTRLVFVSILIYQTMAEAVLILRWS